MSEFKYWCGNCQIKIYIQRHYGRILTWQDCPYVCEYATAVRNSYATAVRNSQDCGADMRGERDEVN